MPSCMKINEKSYRFQDQTICKLYLEGATKKKLLIAKILEKEIKGDIVVKEAVSDSSVKLVMVVVNDLLILVQLEGKEIKTHEIYLKTTGKDESFRAYHIKQDLQFILLYQTYFVKVDFKSTD